jgi:hypothetical protein
MAARPRQKGQLDLPPHLYTDKKRDGSTYYRYQMPDGIKIGIGSDKQEAIEVAQALNAEISRNKNVLAKAMDRHEEIVTGPIPNVEAAFDLFNSERLMKKKYSDSSRNNHRQQLNNYKQAWGIKGSIDQVEHRDITTFLNSKPAHSYQKHQGLLIQAWQFFVHQGWCTENLPEKTMLAILPEKVRLPISHDELMAIRAISPDYVQRIIDLALHSSQRREDLTKLDKSMVSLQANTLTVRQGKTENYKKPIYIQVDMHPELRQAVIDCLSDRLAFICPYLLHYRPKKMTRQARECKQHHLAMTPGFCSREFAMYRDKSGLFAHLEPEQRPTLHEIRSLSEFMITEKYGKEYAMALAGHTTEAMYDHYVKRHRKDEPVRISFR